MKTYEPLPLLDCIKELTSHPPSPQKSLDMNDEDQDQDGTSFLDEFKANSPATKTFMNNDIQIKTIESEYSQVEGRHPSPGEGQVPAKSSHSPTIPSNPCAKSHNAIMSNHSSDSNVKSSQPLGIESLPNLVILPESSTHCCHTQESQLSDSIDKNRGNRSIELNGYCDSRATLSNLEMLSPYVRTNEFINEILKSPVRPEPVAPYEDQALPCGPGG